MCLNTLKAMCRMLESASLWHRKFGGDPEQIGFTFNAHDACTANRSVNGKAHTMRFYMDNLMSSHTDKKVNDKFLMWLNEQCGKCGEVKATGGDKHDHLRMTFGFKNSEFKMDMIECIGNVTKEFPIKFKEIPENMTPAGVDPFSRDTSKKLNEEMKTMFHRTMTQGSFVCKRA